MVAVPGEASPFPVRQMGLCRQAAAYGTGGTHSLKRAKQGCPLLTSPLPTQIQHKLPHLKAIVQYGEELKEKRPNLYSVSPGHLKGLTSVSWWLASDHQPPWSCPVGITEAMPCLTGAADVLQTLLIPVARQGVSIADLCRAALGSSLAIPVVAKALPWAGSSSSPLAAMGRRA